MQSPTALASTLIDMEAGQYIPVAWAVIGSLLHFLVASPLFMENLHAEEFANCNKLAHIGPHAVKVDRSQLKPCVYTAVPRRPIRSPSRWIFGATECPFLNDRGDARSPTCCTRGRGRVLARQLRVMKVALLEISTAGLKAPSRGPKER